jgi:hypothetical protein
MSTTSNLSLPYILAAQAQKHVTHNEALRALDALVQLAVVDRDLAEPPSTPAEGARYIVAASPSGAWNGHANDIAAYQDGAWAFYTPQEGWIAWLGDENSAVVFDGSAWTALTSGGGGVSLNPATGGLVGINATADSTNRLSLSSPASLFNHDGAGHQQKINKAAAGDTASQLYQTGFSGRAEIGLTGDDDFHFKVSPDGTTWHEALVLDRSTGAVTHKPGARHTFQHDASLPGLRLVPVAGDPATLLDGDIWYNATTGKLRKREAGVSSDIGSGGGGGVTDHGALTGLSDDDHTQYHNDARGDARYSQLGHTHANATTGANGFMSAADKSKLDGIAANANNYAHPNHTGDVTSVGDGATTIANDAVTNAKLADVATATIKGRATTGTGDPEDLTGTQATALLDVFTSGAKGLAPASGGGTTNFLRADGTWAAPAGGGGGPNVLVLGTTFNTTSATLTAVTGMSFAANADKTYLVRFYGVAQTASTTCGVAIGLDIPSGTVIGQNIHNTSATALGGTDQIADAATTSASATVRAANTDTALHGWWIVAVGATAGNIGLMVRTEVAGTNAALMATRSVLLWEEIT